MWELDYKESWVQKNRCFWTVVWEKTLESPLDSKKIQPVHPKGDQTWVFNGRTDAEVETPILWPPDWCKELTHLKRPWCWERLRAEGEGDNRGWDGWMASLTLWTRVWVNSRSWWWTGRPGVLWFMGSQRVRHNWATELNWTMCMDFYVNKGFISLGLLGVELLCHMVILYLRGINYVSNHWWASLMAQLVKNPPAMWETWVWSLGCEDPLEKGKATQSSILAWRIPQTV